MVDMTGPGDRLDTKGRRVGKRAAADKGKFPKRNEAGLCPGLEETIEETAGYLEGLVEMGHVGHPGDSASCGRAPCAPIRLGVEKLRDGLAEWTGERSIVGDLSDGRS